jgi:hypothetical protein
MDSNLFGSHALSEAQNWRWYDCHKPYQNSPLDPHSPLSHCFHPHSFNSNEPNNPTITLIIPTMLELCQTFSFLPMLASPCLSHVLCSFLSFSICPMPSPFLFYMPYALAFPFLSCSMWLFSLLGPFLLSLPILASLYPYMKLLLPQTCFRVSSYIEPSCLY